MLQQLINVNNVTIVLEKLQHLASIDKTAAIELFSQFLVTYARFIQIVVNIIQFSISYFTGNGLLVTRPL